LVNPGRINLFAAAALSAAALTCGFPAFGFTQIDFPGSTSTVAYGINDAGQIVGDFTNSTGFHAFVYADGTFTQLDIPGASGIAAAQGINNVGQIVGTFGNNFVQHGFVYTSGNFTQLDVPGLSGLQQYTSPTGINDAGQIVGFSRDSRNFGAQGFVYDGRSNSFTQLNVPGATDTEPFGINRAGQISGGFGPGGPPAHGFVYADGRFTQLDVPGAIRTEAHGINDAGQIVGDFTNSPLDPAANHIFLYTDGRFTQLAGPSAFQTYTSDINNTGQIVGWYSSSPTGTGVHGFLTTATATGDPHFTTYDGVHYDYQGIGDFLLTRSTIDRFAVQVRTRSIYDGAPVTVMSEAAATLCNHIVTFDVDRASAGGSFVWIDGSPSSLSVASPVLNLGTCRIDELSPEHYQVFWNTGEMLDVTDNGTYLDLSSQLSWIDGLGSMEGLLSSDLNPDAWRLTDATLLVDPVPEPTSISLLSIGIGLTGIAIARRHKVSVKCSRRE
jgi:probable HAF family extracellular repeat protein